MPEECERTVEYRKYKRRGEVHSMEISKAPDGAPNPTKTRAEAKTELEAAVDTDCENRNAEPIPSCHPCKPSGETSRVEVYPADGRYQWRETYTITDANGNEVSGTALYTAWGPIDIEMTIYTKTCAPRQFGNKLAMLEGFDFEVPAETLAALDYGLMIELANRDPKAMAALGLKPVKGGKKT